MPRIAALLCFLCIASSPVFTQPVNLTSSNLPIVIINTNGQEIIDDPKITADMAIIFNGAGVRNNVTDVPNHYNGKIGIEIRGKSSQMFPMKSYGLELWDNNGKSIEKSLFGMPKESDWILYAPYTDKTLMRNFLAYTMSRELGHWAARCMYVEVIINGDYRGVYVFMEKIKRVNGRLGTTKMAATDISGDAVTGGYIIKIDKKDPDDDGWWSNYPAANSAKVPAIEFLYEYPKAEDIAEAQKQYIKNYVDSFETALNGKDFQDPGMGFRKFADEISFIDYFLVNEISRNIDGYRLSTFLFKDRQSKGGKLNAGPVWDYDLAFRNAEYCSGSSISGWAYQFNNVCPGDFWQIPFWWDRLIKDSNFVKNLRTRWFEKRTSSLSETRLVQLIDSINTLVSEAQQRHFTRWPVLGQYIWPNPQPIPNSFAEEITTLKNWISQRLLWIDDNLPQVIPADTWPLGTPGTMLVKIYPNPLPDKDATVRLHSRIDQTVHLQVVDLSGRVVFAAIYDAKKGFNNIRIDRRRWIRGGIYFFRFSNNSGEKLVEKIIKE